MHRGRESIVIAGRLETGKLSSGGLCVVDDVGNRIVVERSLDGASVPHELVGKRVMASGTPSYDERGRLRAFVAAKIEQVLVPAQWQSDAGPAGWRLPQILTGPEPDGGADFDDDEWAEFLAAVGVVVPRGEEERD